MSATAILLRDSGVAVTGSDEGIYPPISQVLAREAFACQALYAAQNIPDEADLIVIGKNARLVPSVIEEVAEAFTRAARPQGPKKSVLRRSARAPFAWTRKHCGGGIFRQDDERCDDGAFPASAGLDPSWMIGAIPLSPARASNAGAGKLFLLEGDEYPSSNTDNDRSFCTTVLRTCCWRPWRMTTSMSFRR